MHYLTVFFSHQRINLDEKSFSNILLDTPFYSSVVMSTMHSAITFMRGFKVVFSDPGPAAAREQPAAGGEPGAAPRDGQDC